MLIRRTSEVEYHSQHITCDKSVRITSDLHGKSHLGHRDLRSLSIRATWSWPISKLNNTPKTIWLYEINNEF